MKVKEVHSIPWSFAAVYGSPSLTLRRKLFTDLTRQSMGIHEPWLVAGDFNSVTSPDEVSNPDNWHSSRCADFTDWIFQEGLIDLGFLGTKFTWMRGTNQASFRGARLDRGLCNADWKIMFPDSLIEHLPIHNSDHAPLLIRTSPPANTPSPRPFRFNMAWSAHHLFHSFIHQTWNKDIDLELNKSLMAQALTVWNKETFGNISHRKRRLTARLGGIQRRLAEQCSPNLIKLDRKLRNELEDVLYQEELLWFQRSREQWIVSGDCNTHFYHVATSVKNNSSKISKLREDSGNWITDETVIRDHIRCFFADLFRADQAHSVTLPRGRFPPIHDDEWSEVNKPFSPEEIKQALFDMSPCKAPGPDGFSAGFYQQTWQIVGDLIVTFASKFFENGSLPEGSNDTIITLIPKTENPETVRQLRPIGLCNVTYKILTKAMTSRLKNISQKIVGMYQTSFVPGRQITDNILLYQEVLNSFRTKKGAVGWMVWKIDLEKAYDCLSWDFIQDTLEDIGFNQSWRRNILACIRSPRIAIAWNGERSDWFTPGRGIRQGDPISPLLFVFCMERLSHLIEHATSAGQWKGIKLSRQGPLISHLLFADDMVLFGEASSNQAEIMMQCLDSFGNSSGERVNLLKSSIYFSNNTQADVQQAVLDRTGIPRVNDLGRYLGVPSIHGRLKVDTFAGIIDKIRNRLAGWRSKSLSLAGRLVLAQSVLSTIPYYTMQTTLIPKGVIASIERMIRNFLWGAKEGERKCNLVNWNTVTQCKDSGGLGIRRLEEMNISFFAKLGWRLMSGDDSLWAKVFKSKYAISNPNPLTWRPKQNMSNAWKGILRSAPVIHAGSIHQVHNGRNTLFWLDIWIGDRPLRELATYQISELASQLTVADYWSEPDGWKWDILENCLQSATLDAIAATIVCPEGNLQDQVVWREEISGSFSVSSAYELLSKNQNTTKELAWDNIWKLKIPTRIKTFLWLVRHNKVMTNTNRLKRGFTTNDNCWFCTNKAEDIEHVLRTCPKARDIWPHILPEFAPSQNTLPFKEWFDQGLLNIYDGRLPSSSANLFAISVWWIWKWRNDAIFNNHELPLNLKISWIRNQHREIDSAFARASHPSDSLNTPAWKRVTWTIPHGDYTKINIDGSVCPQTHAVGCAGIARDNSGNWIGGFTSNIGSCSPLMAEAWAALRGIQLAKSLNLQHIILESDSKTIVEGITEDTMVNSSVHNLLVACRRELQGIRDWRIAWIAREQNGAADALARIATARPRGVYLIPLPPAEIVSFLEVDYASFPLWRFSVS
ncbi:PREDICTED: uncharacterized protein LOC109181186 [Ipomoea nil]|uniref:uncharacterized protein LOC109181186 n=1 Tax=Ipomoea nil TaxID=35883 RepID=UPI000900CB24|nr:PREDICTED: uncharacterized protein LOC109181186 [Ipomoea nil]